MSTAIKIPFATQEMGYDRSQVDRYVQKLADEYKGLQQKYNELAEQRNYAQQQPPAPPAPPAQPAPPQYTPPAPQQPAQSRQDANIEAIGKALIDAEVKAIQIVAEARNEASRIIGGAYAELGKIQQEKDRVTTEINALARKLMEISPNVEDRHY